MDGRRERDITRIIKSIESYKWQKFVKRHDYQWSTAKQHKIDDTYITICIKLHAFPFADFDRWVYESLISNDSYGKKGIKNVPLIVIHEARMQTRKSLQLVKSSITILTSSITRKIYTFFLDNVISCKHNRCCVIIGPNSNHFT